VYQRSLTIIQSSLQQYQLFEQQPDVVEEPDRTFIVVSLDLLSGLTQGLAANMAQLIEASQPSLLHVMALCLGVSCSLYGADNVGAGLGKE
jgi:transportin-1